MIEFPFGIIWPIGFAGRSTSLFAHTASKFKCRITVKHAGIEVNEKEMMGLMLLAAETGSEITVTFDGEDERAALQAIADLFVEKFYDMKWTC